jgi:hypothetical protein
MKDRGVALKTVGKSLRLSVRFPPGTKEPGDMLLSYLSEILPSDEAPARDIP